MPLDRSTLKRLMGYAFVAGVWLTLLGLIAVFGIAYAVYADLKAPERSQLVAGTRAEYLADLIYGRFRSSWGITPDAELGFVPKVGAVRMHSPEYDVTMTYTEQGGRLQPTPPDGADLVVMVGDSYTAGLGVADDQTFSAILQARYGQPTVNTGVIAYGTSRELWRARRLGLLAKGSLFVIQFCDNDAAENHAFVAHPFVPASPADSGPAWVIGRRQEYLEISYLNVVRASVQQMRFLAGANGLYRTAMDFAVGERISLGSRIRMPDKFFPDLLAADFLAVLDHFPEIKGKPIIVIELTTRGSHTGFLDAVRRQTRQRPHVVVLDLHFRPEDFFRFDGHLNPHGHATVAAQLHPVIARLRRRSD